MLRPSRSVRRRENAELELRRVIGPFTAGQRGRLVLVSALSILGGFADAAMLLIIARVAFGLAGTHDKLSVSIPIIGQQTIALTTLLVIAAVLVVFRTGLQWFAARTGARITAEVALTERRALTRLLLNASWELQSGLRGGRAQELVGGYVQGTAGALGGLISFLTSSFTLAAMLAAALVVNPIASVGAGVAALLIGLMLRPLRSGLRRLAGRRANANLIYATDITEMTAALQEVRIFGVGANIERHLGDEAEIVADLDIRAGLRSAVIPTLYQGVAMLLIVGALGIVYAAGLTGLASIGGVVLIMLRALSSAQGVQSSIQGMHAAAPFAEMLLAEKERLHVAAVAGGGDPISQLSTIEFRDVSFAYQPEVPVLRGVTFSSRPGEIIGIVGPSGSGKSTLVQLLLRLREPESGSILADGRDVRELSVDDWYQRMTFVPQDAHLFAGTVGDNIRFFRDHVDQAAIERAAKLAHLHDDIVAWPRGYDTPVGERGGQLSGGQRQRLCIARALVGDPDVVVLDEPTSALDVKSESLMRETLEGLAPTKTVFVIAHRLSTLSICARIMVILNGEMQGFDTPDELENSNPFYREALVLSGMR